MQGPIQHCLHSGWPDEFPKKSPKMLPNPFFKN
jgi:hypothetical protein